MEKKNFVSNFWRLFSIKKLLPQENLKYLIFLESLLVSFLIFLPFLLLGFFSFFAFFLPFFPKPEGTEVETTYNSVLCASGKSFLLSKTFFADVETKDKGRR